MSLDGFIADINGQAGPLSDWYYNGNAEVTGTCFHASPASDGYLRAAWPAIGAGVTGRRLFDLINGWNGRPAVADAVFVVTHQPPADWPFPDAGLTAPERRPGRSPQPDRLPGPLQGGSRMAPGRHHRFWAMAYSRFPSIRKIN